MAFSFGNKSPAPAFGGSSGGFGTPAPAPFGAAPAPFGAAPAAFGTGAPAGGSLFGNTVASPAPSGLFGSPAPAPGGLFGTTATGGLFGSNPSSGGLFGSQPAPAQPQPPPPSLSTQMHYSQLPPQIKQAIDKIHEQMMKHKRSVAQVQTMAPVLLRNPTKPADVAAGTTPPLLEQLQIMALKLQEIESNLQACGLEAMRIKAKYEQTTTQTVVHGIWPVEALASRRGIQLNPVETKSNPTINDQIRQSLELQAAHVDRLEKIPSPYMWQSIEDMESRLRELQHTSQLVTTHLAQVQQVRDMGVASVVVGQTDLLVQVDEQIKALQRRMEDLRSRYRVWEKDANVLDQQQIRDLQARQKRDEIVKIGYIKAAGATPASGPAPSTGFGQAPASTPGGGLFGSSAPAPGGLFGSAPAPAGGGFGAAPKPGGLFGSTPAPAPGGLFGSTPAPAPGGAFGSTPAPAAGSLFGSTPAPAPGGAFGSTPAPAAGSLFGSTPGPAPGGLFSSTPAPAAGGGFGSTPAPASGGLFGSTTPAPGVAAPAFGAATSGFGTSTSKPKNKSRSSRRK